MEFPYNGWILQPSFKPVETTFVEDYSGWTGQNNYHVAQSGKYVLTSEIYKTKTDAICAGFEKTRKQQVDIDKKQANINKRNETLKKYAD